MACLPYLYLTLCALWGGLQPARGFSPASSEFQHCRGKLEPGACLIPRRQVDRAAAGMTAWSHPDRLSRSLRDVLTIMEPADAARLFKVHPATVSRLLARAYAK